eukprot:3636738-Rhodomonas_salina.1
MSQTPTASSASASAPASTRSFRLPAASQRPVTAAESVRRTEQRGWDGDGGGGGRETLLGATAIGPWKPELLGLRAVSYTHLRAHETEADL